MHLRIRVHRFSKGYSISKLFGPEFVMSHMSCVNVSLLRSATASLFFDPPALAFNLRCDFQHVRVRVLHMAPRSDKGCPSPKSIVEQYSDHWTVE